MIENIKDIPNSCGIYKIVYDNGKIYIGQSINIRDRALEHNSKNKQLCDIALKKHSAYLEILQDNVPIGLLDVFETNWINYYQSYNKDIGYNILKDGNVSGKRGIDNSNAVFTEKELVEIIDLLQNHLELSYTDIAEKYGVCQNTILRISLGYSYKQNNIIYPIRRNNHQSNQKNSILDYFSSEKDLLDFKEDLFYRWDLSLEKDIPEKWNIPKNICRAINHGKKFAEYGKYEYPIRSKSNILISQEKILKILYDLRNSNKSMTLIGQENSLHRSTIGKINSGIIYPIKNYDYPARRKKI